MAEIDTPLDHLLRSESTFLYYADKLWFFEGMGDSNPALVVGDHKFASTPVRDYKVLEAQHTVDDEIAGDLQREFLREIFFKHFYSSDEDRRITDRHHIIQYVTLEAIPELMLSFSQMLGIDLPSKDKFEAAQDMVLAQLGGSIEPTRIDPQVVQDVVQKEVADISLSKKTGNPEYFGVRKRNTSILATITGGRPLLGLEGNLYELREPREGAIKLELDGKVYGLVNEMRTEYSNSLFRGRIEDHVFLSTELREDYRQAYQQFIKSKALDDQTKYLDTLKSKALAADTESLFDSDAKITIGDGEIRVGCYWLDDRFENVMMLYLTTPRAFLRGVKPVDGELLYWEFEPNEVTVEVTATESGDLYIRTPRITHFARHPGVSGSLRGGRDDQTKHWHLCGVQGGQRHKPRGEDAVDLINLALTYYLNGISPQTVRDHGGGANFIFPYELCFPPEKGIPEYKVDERRLDLQQKGEILWKGNHMHEAYQHE